MTEAIVFNDDGEGLVYNNADALFVRQDILDSEKIHVTQDFLFNPPRNFTIDIYRSPSHQSEDTYIKFEVPDEDSMSRTWRLNDGYNFDENTFSASLVARVQDDR